MPRLRREDHPGLTDDQFARTEAILDRMICRNIDWLADRARLSDSHLQSQIDWYEDRARDRAHECPATRSAVSVMVLKPTARQMPLRKFDFRGTTQMAEPVILMDEEEFQSKIDAAFLALDKLPSDVRRLVIAGRRAFDLGYADEEFCELDKALEPFSYRVPYDNED